MNIHLFPGQGSQYHGMTAALQSRQQVADLVARAEGWAWNILGCRFGDALREGRAHEGDRNQRFLCDQIRIVLGSLALHQMLLARGVHADWRVGHSLGEIAALAAAGWIDSDTALRIVCHRSRAILEHAPPGGMTAVTCSAERVASLLSHQGSSSLALSTINAPDQVTVSGVESELTAFETVIAAAKLGYRRLNASYPFHGPLMTPAALAFAVTLVSERFSPGAPVWSPIIGRAYSATDQVPDLIARHLILPVNFMSAVEALAQIGTNTWVEVGGRNALTGLVRRTLVVLSRPAAQLITTSLPDKDKDESIQVESAATALLKKPLILTDNAAYSLPSWPTTTEITVSPPQETYSMLSLTACTNEQLHSIIVAASSELARRAQTLGSLPFNTNSPQGWPQQPFSSPAYQQPVAQVPLPTWPGAAMPPAASSPSVVPPHSPPTFQPSAPPIQPLPPSATAHLLAEPMETKPVTQPQPQPPAPPAATTGVAVVTAAPSPQTEVNVAAGHADPLIASLIGIYQKATEYPIELLDPDADLEADLGIDSVKQMQILGLIKDRHGFTLPADLDMKSMRTIREVADAVRHLVSSV